MIGTSDYTSGSTDQATSSGGCYECEKLTELPRDGKARHYQFHMSGFFAAIPGHEHETHERFADDLHCSTISWTVTEAASDE